MDDLYQNAWSETAGTAPAFKSDSRPAWSSPSTGASPYDEEADLAAPSWSTGVGIRWDEPSDSPGFSWSQADGDAGWGASTYEGITLGTSPIQVVREEIQPELPSDGDALDVVEDTTIQETNDYVALAPSPDQAAPSLPSSPVRPSLPSPPSERSLSPISPKPSLSPTPSTVVLPTSPPEHVVIPSYEIAPERAAPPSPDGFGTFESGLTDDAPGFSVTNANADPWGASAWADAKPEADEDEPVVDEWERAKQEKAKQDRRVPPEVLANILSQSEDLSREISPDAKEVEQSSEKDAWRSDRRSGIEGVPGLPAFEESFLPPLSLQPLVRFSQAQVGKKMASSVKLTKNLPIARGSPMSHYLAAKGSTAWEISVKERKEVVEDDVPIGWRIVEKASVAPVSDPAKDKKSGGLFSFWGRRQSQVVTTASAVLASNNDSRPTSTDKPRSPTVSEAKSERASQDSVRSLASNSVAQLPSPSKESAPAVPAPPTSMSSYGSAPDPVLERSATPPSAVSRFLNRFSRRGGGGNPRSSLALSSDDLEFLSDIVPSANDEVDEDGMDALEAFISTKREPVASVLPPPLAPPPRATPPVRPISAARNTSGGGSKPSSPVGGTNDLDALFGSLGSGSAISPPSNGSQTSLPSLGTPFDLGRPLTPSSTPGAGPSKPSLVPAPSSQPSSRPASRLQTSPPLMAGFALPPPPSFRPVAPSVASKPKPTLSSPFPLPPLTAAARAETGPMSASSTSSSRNSYQTASENSPPSPTSALPLGELYPHLVNSPQRSAQALLFEGKNQSTFHSSPLGGTTMASTFAKSSNSTLRPPSQGQNAKSPTAVPLTSNLFDDDDFADFQSPVKQLSQPSFVPPPIAKSPRTLAAASAANTALHNPPPRPQTLSTLSPFAIPPPAMSSSGASANGLKTSIATLDDDDFADFHSSPISNVSPQSTPNTSLFINSESDKALLTPRNGSTSFNGLDDLFGNSLATPSPPRVPAKPAPPLAQPPRLQPPAKAVQQSFAKAVPPLQPPPQFQRPATQPPAARSPSSTTSTIVSGGSSRRRSHAAEHVHTLNLLELAAAKQGQRWPAPASPLPAPIPAPGPGVPTKAQGWSFDIMDDEEPSAAAHAQPLASSFPVRPSSGLETISGSVRGGSGASSTSPPPPPLEGPSPMNTGSSAANSSAAEPASDPLFDAWDFGRTSSPPVVANRSGNGNGFGLGVGSKPANGAKTGGLSAQDLSFFEGL